MFSGRDKGLQAVLEKAGQIVRQPGRTHTRTGTNDITHNPAMVSYALKPSDGDSEQNIIAMVSYTRDNIFKDT